MKLPVKYDDLHYTERRKVREEYIRRQGGLCHYCGQPLDGNPSKTIMNMSVKRSLFPPGFFNWPVHLHHSHKTGMTVGAVHNRCNAVLWQYEGE
jgi:5-methylcytosine-specific restriction endonuclease McrA